jgi:phosphoglycolate phosphatase
MTIRGLLFDKDGTLIDSDGTWVPIYRKLLSDQFGLDAPQAEAMMEAVGYDPSTDGFIANSMLASGTTRQLVEIWWPDLDEAGIEAKLKMIDVDYAPLSKTLLKPLMPLAPLLNELRAMNLRVGVATNDSHYSAVNHMAHLGVLELFDEVIAHAKAIGRHDQEVCCKPGFATL